MSSSLSQHHSTIGTVVASPLYRGATIALFLSGLGTSMAAPQIASYLVNELNASLTVAGLFYLTNLTAPIAGFLVGTHSDRSGDRMTFFRLCALAGFLGWLAFAISPLLWMPFVISAVILCFSGAAASQLFAAIHDELTAHPTPHGDGVINSVRMALTAGWVVGPVVGSMLADATSRRMMFIATAVCFLAQIVPLGSLRTSRVRHVSGDEVPSPSFARMVPLLVFTAIYICVYAGESVKYAYLPIYMTDHLELSASLKGTIIGIQPLVELVLMPIAVLVSRRTGMLRLMTLAACFGVIANILFATSGTATGLLAGQILMGGVWGVYAGLGIIVAQRLLPAAVATASAIFMSSTAISSAFGGLSGGLGVAALGLPHVFFVPMAMGIVAIAGLLVMPRIAGEAM